MVFLCARCAGNNVHSKGNICDECDQPEPEVEPPSCSSPRSWTPLWMVAFDPTSWASVNMHVGGYSIDPMTYNHYFGTVSDEYRFGQRIVSGLALFIQERWAAKSAWQLGGLVP
jgi:hypothetical protein